MNIMSTLEGKLVANNMKVGIVVARFNEFITNKLLGGAMDGLLRHDGEGRRYYRSMVAGGDLKSH